jgi:ribonucleoside-diphosphate reductase alpha chain
VSFVVRELRGVYSASGGMFNGKRYVRSLVAAIADRIEEHLIWLGAMDGEKEKLSVAEVKSGTFVVGDKVTVSGGPFGKRGGTIIAVGQGPIGEICASCGAPSWVAKEGCHTCLSCGASDCG